MASSGFTPMATFPSPSPFYGFPSASPYAATFPTPASGSSQNWPTHPTTPVADPPPFPCFWSAPYAYPYTAACPAPAYGPSSFGPGATSSPAAQPAPNHEHFQPSWCSPSHPIPLTLTAPNQEHQPPHPPITMNSITCANSFVFPSVASHGPSVAPLLEVHGPNDVSSSPSDRKIDAFQSQARDNTAPVLADVFGRTPEVTSHTPSRFSNMDAAASSSKISFSFPLGESLTAPTPLCVSAPAMSASTAISATAYVARHVFGEIPTPSSWHGTHAATPNYCYGHQTPVQRSCIQDENTKLNSNHQSFTPPRNDQLSEKETCSVTEAQKIRDMMAQIQTKLKIMSENLSQALKRMKSTENPSSSVSTAASTTSSQCSSAPSISPSPATASFAQQMFGEMPAPRLEYENYSSGNPNTIQSSCVHGESTNIGEQTVDEVPESYGFNHLSSHSVFLADGTERSYYALPESFALERVVPEPVFVVYDDKPDGCSNEFDHVFTSTPEEQSHEEEKQETEQLLRCFSKVPETTQTSASLNYSSYVFGFTLELQQQDDERACNCPVLKAYNSDVTRSTQLCIAPSVTELRLLWDPGALHMHSGITINSTRTTTNTEWSKFSSPTSCELPQSASVQWSILSAQHFLDSTMKKGSIFSAARPLPWDQWSAILLLHHGLWEFSIRPATRLKWNPGVLVILHLYTATHRIVTHRGTSAYLHSSKANLCNQVGTYGISTDLVFTFSGDTVAVDCCNLLPDTIFLTMLLVVVLYYSQGHGVENRETMQWDPGVKISFYTWLDFLTVWSKTDTSLSCTHIPDLASWANQPVSSAVCIWDPGIGISSPMYNWLPSLTAATEKPLSSLQTPEPATWLSLVNNDSYAWDPGTLLIQNKSVLLLLFTEEKEIVTLIIDNWKFRSQQSVKTNNTAKNLLSLKNYLQTWEMDIMLITFLPP